MFGYSPGLAFTAFAGGWQFDSPGNAAVPMGGVAGLNARVKALISATGDGPGNTVHAEMRLASDNSLLGSVTLPSDTSGHLPFLYYAQHSGDSRADRQGFDIDNIVIESGFVPEPSTCVLFAIGFVGLAGCGRRKRN